MLSLIRDLRRHLGWKLFLTYFTIIAVTGIALITAAELHMPVAFERHLAAMATEMGDSLTLEQDLFRNFRQATIESVSLSIGAATILALALSLYVSRRISSTIRRVMLAARRIAAGHYEERIRIDEQRELDELGQLAIHFNQMAAALDRIETTRQELIGNVAHELRTPLTSIKGYMEGLIDGVLPAEPATFEKIRLEADRLQRLVNDLQELSRVEAGAIPLELKPISVSVLLERTIEHLHTQFEDKGVALETHVSPSLPKVRADEDRLYQVLLNLVGNALQYTPAGGQVTVRTWAAAEFVYVEVRDTGIGITPEHLPRLFDRFYREDHSRSRAGGGSGIGLTIAKHLVEAHGGKISAYSAGIGQGSVFTFSIPIA
jgi:signal transduction histidine kinase